MKFFRFFIVCSSFSASPTSNLLGSPGGNENEKVDDLTTVKGFMKAFGITEDDMKCAKFTRIDKTSYDIDSGKVIEIGSYISESMTNEEVQAWIEKIIAKLDSLSDDGKIMTYGDGELTVDYMMAKSMKVASGSYIYKGKKLRWQLPCFRENWTTKIRTMQCRRAL